MRCAEGKYAQGLKLKEPGRPFEGLPGIGDFVIAAEPAAAAGLPIR
jgi:hypothetical protein